MSKNLILYYSREGENYWEGGALRNLEKGNTRYVAEFATCSASRRCRTTRRNIRPARKSPCVSRRPAPDPN